jgi:hypothetical protein
MLTVRGACVNVQEMHSTRPELSFELLSPPLVLSRRQVFPTRIVGRYHGESIGQTDSRKRPHRFPAHRPAQIDLASAVEVKDGVRITGPVWVQRLGILQECLCGRSPP